MISLRLLCVYGYDFTVWRIHRRRQMMMMMMMIRVKQLHRLILIPSHRRLQRRQSQSQIVQMSRQIQLTAVMLRTGRRRRIRRRRKENEEWLQNVHMWTVLLLWSISTCFALSSVENTTWHCYAAVQWSWTVVSEQFDHKTLKITAGNS